jgi:hypothetical protein
LLADTAKLVLAAARVLPWHEPDPAEKSRPDRKAFGSATEATNAVASMASTCDLRHPWFTAAGHDADKLFHSFTSNRCDDAKFGKMRADRIDYGRLLADEKMARAVEHYKQLCCSGVLVATNRMFGQVTASQMASASVASFFCRLT